MGKLAARNFILITCCLLLTSLFWFDFELRPAASEGVGTEATGGLPPLLSTSSRVYTRLQHIWSLWRRRWLKVAQTASFLCEFINVCLPAGVGMLLICSPPLLALKILFPLVIILFWKGVPSLLKAQHPLGPQCHPPLSSWQLLLPLHKGLCPLGSTATHTNPLGKAS